MKKRLFIILVLAFWGGQVAYAGIFGSHVRSGVYPLKLAKMEAHQKDAGVNICPVMRTRLGEGAGYEVEYKGKTYHLCCMGCVRQFKNDSEKYIHQQKEK